MIPARLVAAVVIVLLVLIAIVVIVGLVRQILDPDSAVLALSTMFSGIVIASLTRGSRGSK